MCFEESPTCSYWCIVAEGGEEGTFLVRESCSSPGNYVLSFIADGKSIHILIQKYKGDAFFSLGRLVKVETFICHLMKKQTCSLDGYKII